MKYEINAGGLVSQYIAKNKISKTELGHLSGISYSSLLIHLDTPRLKTDVLLHFSYGLKHNFFADIAATLPADFTTDAPQDNSKDNQIAALEEELRLVKAERDILLNALKKGE